MSSAAFEAEIRKQIEAKQAQRLQEKIQDQQATLNQYKNYPLAGASSVGEQPQISERERQIYYMIQQAQGQTPASVQNGAPFSGDMNRAEQKPVNLFDDQFLHRGENNNLVSNQTNQTPQELSQMGDRERRIYLRDKERELRNQPRPAGVNAPPVNFQGAYGGLTQGQSPAANQDNSPFGGMPPPSSGGVPNSAGSKRDLMLALKAQQRQQQYQSPTQPQLANQNAQQASVFEPSRPVPSYQPPESMLVMPSSQPATQMQSQHQPISSHNPYPQQPEPSPRAQIGGKIEIPLKQDFGLGNLLNLGEQERRQVQNLQRQKEYQEHLLQQDLKHRVKNAPATPTPAQGISSDHLKQGGLAQIGDHQYKQADSKHSKQVEYKRLLEQQQAVNKATPQSSNQSQKKLAIADQIYNEVMDSHRSNRPTSDYQMPKQSPTHHSQPSQQYQQATPQQQQNLNQNQNRVQSAVGANRQLELQKLQMQETKEMFHSGGNDEMRRKKELEKKREYAAMLQEQMNQKKQQSAQQQRQSAPPQLVQPSQQHGQHSVQQQRQAYPGGQQSDYYQAQMLPQEKQFGGQMGMGPPPADYYSRQQQDMMQEHARGQLDEYPQTQQQHSQPGQPGQPGLNAKEEYRRQLEQQMKEGADKKQRQKEEKLEYERKHDKDIVDVIQASAQLVGGGQPRQRHTDITKQPEVIDEVKTQARLRYQEELKMQVGEQQRRKQKLQMEKRMEDQNDEHRLLREREKLVGRERKEMFQENGKVLDEPKHRHINRSQFEQSNENGGPAASPSNAGGAMQNPRELFLNSPPVVELTTMPTTYSAITMDDQGVSSFGGMPPPTGFGRPQPFSLNMPPTPTTSSMPSMPSTQQFLPQQALNQFMVQPHPQNLPQMTHAHSQPPPMQNQQNQPQNDWQTQQASKMFEDQQKMIQLYQQALEQILKYRNQYFEQAMEMRENILKEREQMLEFEKLKQQQMLEMQQLQQVKNQLGSVQQRREALAPQIQSNLEMYIHDQNQQILSMSQSQRQMQMLLQSEGAAQQQASPRFIVETSREPVEINAQPLKLLEQVNYFEAPQATTPTGQQQQYPYPEDQYGHPTSDEHVNQQIDELALQVERMGQEQQLKSMDFEMSLSSITKLVKVPIQNNLVQKAQQLQQDRDRAALSPARVPTAQREDMLLTTWNENSMEKAMPIQHPTFSQHRHSQNVSPQGILKSPTNLHQVAGAAANQRSQSEVPVFSQMPEETTSPLNQNGRRASAAIQQSSADHRTIESQVSRKQKLLSTSGNLNDRKQTITGSSFYDQTMKNQKIQAETQEIEMHKQMLRIFGNTTVSNVLMQANDNTNDNDGDCTQSHQEHHRDEDAATPSLHVVSDSGTFQQQPTVSNLQQHLVVNRPTDTQHLQYSMADLQSEINIANTVPDAHYLQDQLNQCYNDDEQLRDCYNEDDDDELKVKPLGVSESDRKAQRDNDQMFQQVEMDYNLYALPLPSEHSSAHKLLVQSHRQPTPSSQQNRSAVYNTQSDWEATQELVPVFQGGTSQNNQGMNSYDVQEEEDYAVDHLQQFSPSILRTYDDQSSQHHMHFAQFVQKSGGVMAIELLESGDDSHQMSNQQLEIEEQIQVQSQSQVNSQYAEVDAYAYAVDQEEDSELIAANHQLLIPKKRPPFQQDQEEQLHKAEAGLTKKEQEMMEIAALIRKAQATTNHALETAERQQRKVGQTLPQAISKQPSQPPIVEESEHCSSLGKEEPNTGRNILADLDRIINNLEQQKNMATFGIKQDQEQITAHQDKYKLPDDEYQMGFVPESVPQDNQQTFQQNDYSPKNRGYQLPDDEASQSVIDIAAHTPPEQTAQQQQVQQQRWKTLQEAREAREPRPLTAKSTNSRGKAPLAPKTPRQENDAKSRVSSNTRRDGSPHQVMGKFSQMALNNQANLSDRSQDRSVTSKSPQRVGKYSMMALNTSALNRQDKSVTSKSPQRVGKFAQMALDSSFKKSNEGGNSVSPSVKLGKFASMALAQGKGNGSDISQDDIQQITRKYSNERGASNTSQIQKLDNQQSPCPSILRPVSGSQHSSRYQMPGSKAASSLRPGSTINDKQTPQQHFQSVNNVGTPRGFTTLTVKQQQHFYMSDEEDEEYDGGLERSFTDKTRQIV